MQNNMIMRVTSKKEGIITLHLEDSRSHETLRRSWDYGGNELDHIPLAVVKGLLQCWGTYMEEIMNAISGHVALITCTSSI